MLIYFDKKCVGFKVLWFQWLFFLKNVISTCCYFQFQFYLATCKERIMNTLRICWEELLILIYICMLLIFNVIFLQKLIIPEVMKKNKGSTILYVYWSSRCIFYKSTLLFQINFIYHLISNNFKNFVLKNTSAC